MSEDLERVNAAHRRASAIRDQVRNSSEAMWKLASLLYDFHERQEWLLLDCDTLEEFLGWPEVGITRDQFFRLVSAHRVLVVEQGVDRRRLMGIAPSKVQEILPALKRGDVRVEKALDDAEGMGVRDLREAYADGAEPVRKARCPVCNTKVAASRLEGAT